MTGLFTRSALASDLARLGIEPGDIVMVHAAVSRIGRVLGGPDAVIGALLDAVGTPGTLMSYTDWDASYEDLLDENGCVPAAWRPHIPPYDPVRSRSIRDHGVLAEFLRTTPGVLRSANPGASVAALGAQAEWLVADHPLDYGYGEKSPFAKLVEAGGKVLMLGAPLDTMTLIHHAEHLAAIPDKRIKRCEVPFATPEGTVWRMSEEFDTADAACPQLDGIDYFTAIVESHLDAGDGARGLVGAAESVLVDAGALLRHAVAWLEREAG